MHRVVTFAIVVCLAPLLFAESHATYHVSKTYMLGGDGGWDYIVPEPAQHRVFVGRTNRV